MVRRQETAKGDVGVANAGRLDRSAPLEMHHFGAPEGLVRRRRRHVDAGRRGRDPSRGMHPLGAPVGDG